MENNSSDRPLRHHISPTSAGSGSGGGHREDCWSEGATAVLIDAWGERHLRCNRGNLRQNDWKEVADAVNSREDGLKAKKTDIQCKNRIDTLKKKYKIEKAKPPPSSWQFFGQMDFLVGPNNGSKKVSPVTPAPNFTVKRERSKSGLNSVGRNPNWNGNPSFNPNPKSNALIVYSGGSSSRLNSGESSESSLGGDEDERDDEVVALVRRTGVGKKQRVESGDASEEGAFRELARAILKFGEVYERIESSKQQQMMELEKQRMEFIKELEFQKMNMLMETQLEIEKFKRPKKASVQERSPN